jgi:CRP-like cAMP-binding protein
MARPPEPAEVVAKLRGVAMFSELDDAALRQIAGSCEQVALPAGGLLVQEGAEAHNLFILLEGTVTISKRLALPLLSRTEGTDRILHEVSADERPLLGETALLRRSIRRTSVHLRTDCVFYRIPAAELLKLMDANPLLGYQLFRKLSETLLDRLEQSNNDIVKLSAALVFALED